ncbi:cAMP phosphodiesterases class-II-domain-containing protein, partial [Peziza echinospora]
GSGGGPCEDDVSGYLLRSISLGWKPNSLLAVDAGTHLAGIIAILEKHQPIAPETTSNTICPFEGANIPFKSARAKAAHIVRELLSTFLITHAHLDHVSGLGIVSAALKSMTKRKRVAGLPHTIAAIRKHIFNDVIWPNLSDEDGGVGLMTYLRLPESSPEYVPVAEGLSVQAWGVSHGHCMKKHSHKASTAGLSVSVQSPATCDSPSTPCVYDSTTYFIRDAATNEEVLMWGDVEPDSLSLSPRNFVVWNEAARKVNIGTLKAVFIECSFDNSQPDEFLFGHLTPKHLYAELTALATRVRLLREGDNVEVGMSRQESSDQDQDMDLEEWKSAKKRKRVSIGYFNEDQEISARRWGNPHKSGFTGRKIPEEEAGNSSSTSSGETATPNDEPRQDANGGVSPHCTATEPEESVPPFEHSQTGSENLNPIPPIPASPENSTKHHKREYSREVEMKDRSPVNGKKVEKEGEYENGFSGEGLLAGLLVVVTHVKDPLEDDVDTKANIYEELLKEEAVGKLGCTFVMALKGQTIYF